MSMKLSAEMFNQIVSSLKSDGINSRGHEKRAEGRVGLRCTIDIVTRIPYNFESPTTKAISVSVNNISVCGIGLVTGMKLEDGSEFIARFNRDGSSPVPILYKVRHARRIANDVYSIGANLERVLPDADGEVQPMPGSEKKKKAQKPAKDVAATVV
jgi:hypothetical protein